MKRADQPAIRDTVLLFGLMALFAGIAVARMPSWWSAPFWLAYGGLADNVLLDHRLNSRTVVMNPVSRFIY